MYTYVYIPTLHTHTHTHTSRNMCSASLLPEPDPYEDVVEGVVNVDGVVNGAVSEEAEWYLTPNGSREKNPRTSVIKKKSQKFSLIY
jgi:hypothetical protein